MSIWSLIGPANGADSRPVNTRLTRARSSAIAALQAPWRLLVTLRGKRRVSRLHTGSTDGGLRALRRPESRYGWSLRAAEGRKRTDGIFELLNLLCVLDVS